MGSHRDDADFLAALGSLRPAPRPEFAAELDARAAAGFARPASATGPLRGRMQRLLSGVSGVRIAPRRWLLAAGACAVLAIAAVTTAISISGSGSPPSGHGAGVTAFNAPPPAPREKRGRTLNFDGSGAYSTPEYHAGKSPLPTQAGAGADGAASNLAGANNESHRPALRGATASLPSAASAASTGESLSDGESLTGFAARLGHREVQRAAQIVLASKPAAVREDVSKIYEAVHSFDGIVLRASVRGGSEGEPRASFDLLVPSAKLSDAMAAFSRISEVSYRHEASEDVTGLAMGLGERLRDSRAKIESLLGELAEASSESERVTAEAELRSERRHLASVRAQLHSLQRRTHLSHVSLRIESGAAVSSTAGGWGVGDALDAAGRVLGIAAGVAIVALAVLAPIALLSLLVWLARRTWLRRSRKRALG